MRSSPDDPAHTRSDTPNLVSGTLTPKANAHAERFVRTVRAECLDWLLILGRRHLDQTLRTFVAHYNRERPHRSLQLQPPEATERGDAQANNTIERRDLLGGLIHEYHRAAA